MGDFYNRGGGGITATSVTSDDLEIDSGTLSIDAANNRVGMGTTAPGTQLQVESNAPYVTLKNDTSENTAGGCESRLIFEDHGNNALGQIEVSHVGSSDDEKGQLILSTNNDSGLQAAITIDEAQKVGIGTTDPATSLHVAGGPAYLVLQNTINQHGAAEAESRIIFADHEQNFLAQVEASHVSTGDDDKGQLVFSTNNDSGLTTALTIDDTQTATFGGDVVIGGTTPKLTIGDAGTEDTMLAFDGNAQDFRIGIDDGTDTLEIGVGQTHGTTTALSITADTSVEIFDSLSINSAIADEKCSGITAVFTAGEALERGEVVYFKAADSKMWKAVATASATSRCVAMAAEDISADATGKFLLYGFLQDNGTFPAYTVGGLLYTPEAETSSQNVPEQTAPDTDGDFVQVIGWAVTANMVFFNPSNDIIEVA